MKPPTEPRKDQLTSSASDLAPSPKRRPPKLRPPKPAKKSTPEDRPNEAREQRENGVPERSSGPSDSFPNGVASESSLNNPSDNSTPGETQMSPQPMLQHHRQRVRRKSSQSMEPGQDQVLEREQQSSESPGTQLQTTRVRQILSPEATTQQAVTARNQEDALSGRTISNPANANTGEVVETTEAVSKKGGDQLRLRLDLNLDVEIELKAKIRGDLTLQLL
ncbi:uncharacterized protein N7482_005355 [Penicillium canariense]|uniref:Uncharacterized protein n=1 Tax=Penicillium canariense TaxID=189055 RepID=A0A9W9I287_9EURO|nr:uncharacterized protein N7482_005355 [Penicillium canariense]KAJ5166574.1 hypothetical protein N7482_005355 [Penicillium canariense]